MEYILISVLAVVYFLLGFVLSKHKFDKTVRDALNYERKLPVSAYQKGWLDCLYFIISKR